MERGVRIAMQITVNTNEMYDISMPIEENMKVYKGKIEKKPHIRLHSNFETGTSYESILSMNLHTGTHIDAPLHMIKGGDTLETLPLNSLFTVCKVLELQHCETSISKEDLESFLIEEGDFLLFKTKNSFIDILEGEYIYLDKTGASYLAEKNIKGVGIDALGIERNQSGHETHLALMNKGILIIEGLHLAHVPEGKYALSAFPLSIKGVEASPLRAVLMALA